VRESLREKRKRYPVVFANSHRSRGLRFRPRQRAPHRPSFRVTSPRSRSDSRDTILRKRKWPTVSYRFAVEGHRENRSATRVVGQRAGLHGGRVADEENKGYIGRASGVVQEKRKGKEREREGDPERDGDREERDGGAEWTDVTGRKTRRRALLSNTARRVRRILWVLSQATLSFYFPLFKCQGRLTKTSRAVPPHYSRRPRSMMRLMSFSAGSAEPCRHLRRLRRFRRRPRRRPRRRHRRADVPFNGQ